MNLITDLFKGMIVLSVLAVMQYSCSVKNIAEKASKTHDKGLSAYGSYSRELTGSIISWASYKK